MKEPWSIGVLERRRAAKLGRLAKAGPMLLGSLAAIRVTCGNPRCRCARGRKHRSHILNRKLRGRSRSLYIPMDLVEVVRQWIAEQRRVRRLVGEISVLGERIIRAHVQTRRAKRRNLAAAAAVLRPTRSSRSG